MCRFHNIFGRWNNFSAIFTQHLSVVLSCIELQKLISKEDTQTTYPERQSYSPQTHLILTLTQFLKKILPKNKFMQ